MSLGLNGRYGPRVAVGHVRHIIPIATSARQSAWCISWGEVQRRVREWVLLQGQADHEGVSSLCGEGEADNEVFDGFMVTALYSEPPVDVVR